eukprot:s3234_g3.t1
MPAALEEGFGELLKAQLVAIQQVVSLNEALWRKFENPEQKKKHWTRTAVGSPSALSEPLLPHGRSSPSLSPDGKRSTDVEQPDSRSPLSAISKTSLRKQAMQFGSYGRRATSRLSMDATYSRPINTKDVRSLAKGVLDSINRQAQDPEKLYAEKGCWSHIARSAWFKNLTLFMVLMSTAWIAIDTDYNKQDSEYGYIFLAVDNIICAYFCVEITIRWFACEVCSNALSDCSFLFDLFLAVTMSIETWGSEVIYLVTGQSARRSGYHGISPALRSLRLIRITRAFRMSRLFRSVPELMILVHGMFQGVRSVCTTLILLILVTYTFAVAMVQLLQNKEIGAGKFDNVPTATNFLLMQTLCGFDTNYITSMVYIDPPSFLILLTYQLLGSLTLMNMLTGVMVDVVGTTAQMEQEEQSLKMLKRDIADVVNLTDENHDQTVTAVEFAHMIQNPEAVRKLYEGGVNVLALVDYADFVFRDTAELSLEDFVETVLQFRGQSPATVKDVVDLRVFVSKACQFRSLFRWGGDRSRRQGCGREQLMRS